MEFGPCPTREAQGAILAHSVRTADRVFKKGHVLGADDLVAIRRAGIDELVIARLGDSDVPESLAAKRISEKLAGTNVRVGAPFTGRANVYSEVDGLTLLDAEAIDALNQIDESITVATLAPFERVIPRQILATIKIIPFAAPEKVVQEAERLLANGPILSVAPFIPRKVATIITRHQETRPALLDKTRAAIATRIHRIGSETTLEREVAHSAEVLAPLLQEAARENDLVLIFGASAITDRRDVIPLAIEQAGGTVVHFGMPVDPGNLLLVGKLDGADIIGLPGCARSPKLNGFDLVLWRLAAGLPVGPKEIAAMGVGGLLTEIPLRPQPRDEPHQHLAPRIAAIILAAGASMRMGNNKLLTKLNDVPMVRKVVAAASASAAEPVIVVTGNESAMVRDALAGCNARLVDNPEFASGLSSSLRRGLSAVPPDCDGVIVLLGDMPEVDAALVDKLIAAFDPEEDRAICAATRHGKRGNPVLFARRFFAEIQTIEGDVGARGLIGAYPDLVCEVEADSDAPLIDIDTSEDLAAYRKERG